VCCYLTSCANNSSSIYMYNFAADSETQFICSYHFKRCLKVLGIEWIAALRGTYDDSLAFSLRRIRCVWRRLVTVACLRRDWTWLFVRHLRRYAKTFSRMVTSLKSRVIQKLLILLVLFCVWKHVMGVRMYGCQSWWSRSDMVLLFHRQLGVIRRPWGLI
jgi:hypothetical protein